MRVLIYAGYQGFEFDGNTNTGIGGTEIAIVAVANSLVKFGHEVIVSGQIADSGKINGVRWISTKFIHEFVNDRFDYFDVIISASYIHFLKEFKKYTAKKVFWAHNTHHHAWYNDVELSDADELIKQVDHTVCLTNWHKEQWADKYNIPLDKITVIGHGVDTSTFPGEPDKIKGRFIYSSAPERGLAELLKYWPLIKQIMPHATLEIYSPAYSIATPNDYDCTHANIRCYGTVSQLQLHKAMLLAEYWCYLTDYEETFCITAVEMQYAKVLPIVTKVAALGETVRSGIILNNVETKWKTAVEILSKLSGGIKQKSIEDSFQWAKLQTWNNVSHKWNTFLKDI